MGEKIMSKKSIEDVIGDVLEGDAKRNALDFAAYLRINEIQLEESENYWDVRFKGKSACFIWIDGSDQKPGPWTIWSDQEPGTWIAWSDGENRNRCKDPVVDEHIKEIAWANVNFCANCGGDCSPGRRKSVLGKEFDNVCSSAIAFTNPDMEALNCAKKMIDMRMVDIQRSNY